MIGSKLLKGIMALGLMLDISGASLRANEARPDLEIKGETITVTTAQLEEGCTVKFTFKANGEKYDGFMGGGYVLKLDPTRMTINNHITDIKQTGLKQANPNATVDGVDLLPGEYWMSVGNEMPSQDYDLTIKATELFKDKDRTPIKINIIKDIVEDDLYVSPLGTNGVPWLLEDATDNTTVTPITISLADIEVTVDGANTVENGKSSTYTADLTNTLTTTDVDWSVTGATSTNTKISSTGELTVGFDETATSVEVVATSKEDNTRNGTHTVNISQREVFHITYNGLEGQTHTNPTDYTEITSNITLTDPTARTGYAFDGWYDGANKVTTIVKGSTGNKTFTAKWIPNKHTISFKDVDGTALMADINVNYDDMITKPTDPTKAGYTFNGWYTDQAFNTEWNFESDTVADDMTLYANWTQDNYSITYNGLEGQTHTNPEEYTVETPTITLNDPTARAGYTFDGWYDGVNKVTTIVKGSTGNKTFTAKWIPNKHTISFKEVDGTALMDDINVNYDDTITKPTDPTKAGYTFNGWYTDQAFNTEWNFESDTVADDMTLYANWTQDNYSIAYNGLTGQTHTNPEGYTVETATITLSDPTARTGYTFDGWYDGAKKVTTIVKGSTGNKTFTAKWIPNKHTISFKDVDGTALMDDVTVNYDDMITKPTDPIKVGYVLEGWYTDQAFTTEWNFESDTVTGDITLYGKWVPSYSINYEGLEGETHTNPGSYTEETSTITLNEPTSRKGYTFEGWYHGNDKVTEIVKGSTGNITLAAKWTINDYSITYEGLEGTGHSNANQYTVETSTITLSEPTSRIGYTFEGWFNGNDKVTEIVKGSTGNITLVAKWKVVDASNPETPNNPEQPETPSTPDTPNNPEQPETPSTPDAPNNPEQPNTPSTPGESGNTEQPDTTKQPINTGDITSMSPYLGMALISVIGAVKFRKRK